MLPKLKPDELTVQAATTSVLRERHLAPTNERVRKEEMRRRMETNPHRVLLALTIVEVIRRKELLTSSCERSPFGSDAACVRSLPFSFQYFPPDNGSIGASCRIRSKEIFSFVLPDSLSLSSGQVGEL